MALSLFDKISNASNNFGVDVVVSATHSWYGQTASFCLKIARKSFQITDLCKKVCTCSILKESKIKLAADNMNKAYIKRQVPTKYMLHNSLDDKMPLPTLTLPHCIILSVNKRGKHQI